MVDKNNSNRRVVLILGISLVIIVLIFAIVFLKKTAEGKLFLLNKQVTELRRRVYQDSIKLKRITVTSDSALAVSKYLSKYQAVAKALHTRDSVRVHLKYKVGDIVKLKRDDSRAVISDIIIGGGLYEYYVKYRLQFSNKSVEEVIPEMIY